MLSGGEDALQPLEARPLSGEVLHALRELRHLVVGIARRTILARPLIGRHGRLALGATEFPEMTDGLVDGTTLAAWREEHGGLFVELLA